MSRQDLIEKVETLQNVLIDRATGGLDDNNTYIELREELLSDVSIRKLLPRFVRTCRNTNQFWHYIKGQFGTYGERREYLREEFISVFDMLEGLLDDTDSDAAINSGAMPDTEVETMTNFDPIAVAALTKAVDFLFDQAGKLMEERRESRKKRGEDDDTAPKTKITTKEEVLSWQPKNIYLKDIPQEVKHCLTMIETYRTNKRYTDATIAQFGGFNLAPINIRNELITQEEEIKNWTQKLKELIEKAYGHRIVIVGLD
jgi:hypothetical protein